MDATPRIAITMGDPTGVGPEIIAAAWARPEVHAACRPLVVGRPEILERAARLVGAAVRVAPVDAPEEAAPDVETVPCLPAGPPEAAAAPPGRTDARGGQAAYEALVRAARLALEGRVAGLATAPLSKAALHAAGHPYPGHTELLAELCGADRAAMMLYLGPGGSVAGPLGLGVVHVTLHVALREAVAQLSVDAIAAHVRLLDGALRALAPSAPSQPPRIAVAALNPHAGEEGLFGDEERRVIAPAVARAAAEGLCVSGPLPCDTLMARAAAGEFDGVTAMYHDQGHIALKLLGGRRAVNVTLGLPIVRTSVAHGTAPDVAWRGQADCTGMIAAVQAAAALARRDAPRWWSQEAARGR